MEFSARMGQNLTNGSKMKIPLTKILKLPSADQGELNHDLQEWKSAHLFEDPRKAWNGSFHDYPRLKQVPHPMQRVVDKRIPAQG
jgi:hypothetical protein